MRSGWFKEIYSSQVSAISQREWNYLLGSAVGAIFLIIFLMTAGHLTFEPGRGAFFLRGQTDLKPFWDYLPWVMAFFIPAMSMRLWSEERKSGSIEFLLTLPISVTQAVWGKFWASWKFLGLSLLLTFPIVLTLYFLGEPDLISVILGYLGAWLLAGQMLAISSLCSAMTKSQVTSFIISSVTLVTFLLMDSPSIVDVLDNVFPKYPLALIENLSLNRHFSPWTKGVASIPSIFISVLTISFWNWLTVAVIKKNKSE